MTPVPQLEGVVARKAGDAHEPPVQKGSDREVSMRMRAQPLPHGLERLRAVLLGRRPEGVGLAFEGLEAQLDVSYRRAVAFV